MLNMESLVDGDLYILLFDKNKKLYLERSDEDPKIVLSYVFKEKETALDYADYLNTVSDRQQKVHRLDDIQNLVDWLGPITLELGDSALKLVLVDSLKTSKNKKRPIYKEIATLNKENKN